MGDIATKGNLAWRDHVVDGVPASGAQEPAKSEIRDFVAAVDAAAGWVGSLPSFARALLSSTSADAVLALLGFAAAEETAPDEIAGLVRAWDARSGLTVFGDNVYAIGPAWGTSTEAAQSSSTHRPTIKRAYGPNADDVISFDDTGGTEQYLTFTATATLTEFTVAYVGSIYCDTAMSILGNTGSGASYMRVDTNGRVNLRTADGAAAVTLTGPGEPAKLLNKQGWYVLIVKYSAANEEAQVYLNGHASPVTAVTDGHNFVFDEIGGRQAASVVQCLDGHMSSLLIYDSWLSDADTTALSDYLMGRAATNYYIDPDDGDDASKSPWSTTAPWASIYTAVADFPWIGGEVIALKSGLTTRLDAYLQPLDLTYADVKVTLDGNVAGWGTGDPHQFRCSRAPAPVLTTGTIYDCGIVYETAISITDITKGATTTVVTSDGNKISAKDLDNAYNLGIAPKVKFSSDIGGMVEIRGLTGTVLSAADTTHFVVNINSSGFTNFDAGTPVGTYAEISRGPHVSSDDAGTADHVYYVPGGRWSFWGDVTGYEETNVVSLTRAATPTNAPAVGEWSYYSDNHIYVNAGVALSAGEIEIPIAPSQGAQVIQVQVQAWDYRNLDILFADARMIGVINDGETSVTNVRALFGNSDGIDTFNTAVLTLDGCVTSRIDGGTVDGSDAFNSGDGYAFHDTSTVTMTDCLSVLNGKTGIAVAGAATVTVDRFLAYTHRGIWLATNDPTAGSLTVTNSLIICPAGYESYGPCAIRHSANPDVGVPVLNLYHNTFVSLSNATGALDGYVGFRQETEDVTINMRNNIWTGWNIALQADAGSEDAGWTLNHNCFFDNTTDFENLTSTGGATNVTTDPQLVNIAENLRLSATSPCKGAGAAIASVTTDYAGTARSATAPSIGAYE